MATALAQDGKQASRTTVPKLIASMAGMARQAFGGQPVAAAAPEVEVAVRPFGDAVVQRQRPVHGLGGALTLIAARGSRG